MNIMNDWVVEEKSFIEELLDGKYFMLNQNGVNDVVKIIKDYKSRIDKATEIYKNRNTCKYKKERFMKNKSTGDLMYEALQGSGKE